MRNTNSVLENNATSQAANFSKFENIAKLKFLESLSNNNLKKKHSTIINNNTDVSKKNNLNKPDYNNLNSITGINDFDNNPNLYVDKNQNVTKNNFKDNQSIKENFLLEKEYDFNYTKLSHSQTQHCRKESNNKLEKAYNWLNEKYINIRNDQRIKNFVNPFRNDDDPTGRYCYYCMTATCVFIYLIILFLLINSN